MRLQICQALVGTPTNGDSVKLELEGGRVLYLAYNEGSVPDGNMHNWPRAFTTQRIRSIEIL